MIACLVLPDFAVTLERQADPALATTPLILVEGDRVLAPSREAVEAGIAPGIPLYQARLLCPQAHLMPANPARYQRKVTEILALLNGFTPKIEPEPRRRALLIYADFGSLTGAAGFSLVEDIQQTLLAETRLKATVGLAGGKFPAAMAALAIGLNRMLSISPGQERSFLAPFAVGYLPLDRELARRFRLLGLRTVGQLAGLPSRAVLTQFGPPGRWLHQLARGRDERPVRSYVAEAVERLTYTLDGPVVERTVLAAVGRSLVDTLATRLQARGLVGWTLSLALQLDDGALWEDQIKLRQAVASPERLLLGFTLLLKRARVHCGVTALTLSLSSLTPATGQQLSLLDEPGPVELARWLPELVIRYGSDRFRRANLVDQATLLPERRFQLRGVVEE